MQRAAHFYFLGIYPLVILNNASYITFTIWWHLISVYTHTLKNILLISIAAHSNRGFDRILANPVGPKGQFPY